MHFRITHGDTDEMVRIAGDDEEEPFGLQESVFDGGEDDLFHQIPQIIEPAP